SITDPEVRMLGAEAIFKEATSLGVLVDSNGLEASRDFRRDQLRDMVDAIDDLFLGDRGLLGSQAVPKSTLKGKLFELDWVMDAFMFNFLRDDYDTQVIMSSVRGDRPMGGRPALNRGSDITIRNFKNWTEYFVQLKASDQQKGKPYHPLIEVAYEQNFQDMSPGRLINKIRAYRAFIDSGFDPALADEARRFILPTVVEILGKERTPSDSYDRLADIHGIAPIRKRIGRPEQITLKVPARKPS
ncbi:MAG: hypothetical protein KBC84_06705, partial [Proteobacteria bacterium]|nr:hypothetical protein [Pseudomonadota bacterium]